jgi:hypothetical protein
MRINRRPEQFRKRLHRHLQTPLARDEYTPLAAPLLVRNGRTNNRTSCVADRTEDFLRPDRYRSGQLRRGETVRRGARLDYDQVVCAQESGERGPEPGLCYYIVVRLGGGFSIGRALGHDFFVDPGILEGIDRGNELRKKLELDISAMFDGVDAL